MNKLVIGVFATLALSNSYAQSTDEITKTRFGEVIISEEETNINGKNIEDLQYLNPIYLLNRTELASSDVILIAQPLGNNCPGKFKFLIIDNNGARTTPLFGTCYDDIPTPIQAGEAVAFNMVNLGGEGTTLYIYQNGSVYENGNIVK